MQGRRISYEQSNDLSQVLPGDYWFDPEYGWHAACPIPRDDDGMISCLAWLKNHTVTEHEDKTITVHPSILCQAKGPNEEWNKKHYYHGWLNHGVWTDA